MVGTMIASEVPMQSCMRTSSGTPMMRNTSYSTGTMIAPPPMPNRPARKPASTPPATMIAASQASSPSGTPANIGRPSDRWTRNSGRDVRQFGARVHHMGKRVAQDRNAGAGLDGLRRDVAAERARAGHGVEQAEDMARHGVQPRAARKLALHIGEERLERGFRATRTAPASPKISGSTASSRHGS